MYYIKSIINYYAKLLHYTLMRLVYMQVLEPWNHLGQLTQQSF